MSKESSSRWRVDHLPAALCSYAVVGGLICFWRLGSTGLMAMEGMVVDGARHMLESGNWSVPHVYGEMYTYKPALAYWLVSVPLRLSEMPSAWAIRLPSASGAFGLGLFMLVMIRRLTNTRVGLYAALALVSSVLFQEKVRLAEYDIPLLVGTGIALVAACHNLAAERPKVAIWLLGYTGLAIGFLAKGGPALMAYAPGLLLAAWVSGRFRRLLHWGHVTACAVFVMLVAWYAWSVWMSAGAAAFEQPLLEAKARGLGWLSMRTEDQASEISAFRDAAGEEDLTTGMAGALGRTLLKPLVIWQVCLPWSIALPAAFAGLRQPMTDPVRRVLAISACSFLVAGTVTFMLVSTHESRYYLPLSVPTAILCGTVIGGAFDLNGWWRRGLRTATLVLAAIVALLSALAGVILETPPVSTINRVSLVVLGAAAFTTVVRLGRNARYRNPAGVLIVSALLILAVLSLGVEPRRASTRVLEVQAAEVARHIPASETVWTPGPAYVAGKNSSLFFYLGQRVLAFRPEGAIPPPGSYCIVPSDRISELEESSGFAFSEIVRVEQASRDFLVGRCSWLVEAPPA